VYAGVLVVASAQMATKLGAEIPQLSVPEWLVDRLEVGRARVSTSLARWCARSGTRVRSMGPTSSLCTATGKSPAVLRQYSDACVLNPLAATANVALFDRMVQTTDERGPATSAARCVCRPASSKDETASAPELSHPQERLLDEINVGAWSQQAP
jgi:hypothetical protein